MRPSTELFPDQGGELLKFGAIYSTHEGWCLGIGPQFEVKGLFVVP